MCFLLFLESRFIFGLFWLILAVFFVFLFVVDFFLVYQSLGFVDGERIAK